MKITNIGWTHSTINGSSGCDGCELWNDLTRTCYAGQVHQNRSAVPDMQDDPEYQAWVESMAKHCRCSHDCPCAGVLAGGICDDRQEDDSIDEGHEPEPCAYCRGSGQYDDATPCPWCDGDGTEPW